VHTVTKQWRDDMSQRKVEKRKSQRKKIPIAQNFTMN
jgi:hypothetical protein